MRTAALLLLVSVSSALHAQRPDPELVHVGPKGLFVLTGPLLAREGGPVTGILIERKAGDQGEFKRVAELKPVASAKDVQKGMEKAAEVLPYPIDPGGPRADSIWARIQRHGTREQLGSASNNVAVLLAVHAVWHDADARPGTRYQYRVTTQGNGNQFLSALVDPVARPQVTRLMPARSGYFEHQRELNTWWSVTGDHRPAVVELHRSMDEGPFAVVRPKVRIEHRGQDTVLYQFADTTAARHRVFRYVAKGWDLFGNPMPPSDTLYAASLDPTQMPMPYDLHAVGDSTGRRIDIRWKLDNAPVVKQISLQRSTNSEKDFVTVAELSGDRRGFIDEDIRPATSYFYRFVLEYKATHVPLRGVSFAAVAYNPVAPTPVLDLMADADLQGIGLSWAHPDGQVLGFEVYRGEGNGPLMLAAPRIDLEATGTYAWRDTASVLQGGAMYRYAVRAVSTSHVPGAFGDTVAVLALHNAQAPQPPRDLTVQVDGEQAIVRWEDRSADSMWLGYRVLRTRADGRMDTLHRSSNFAIDTLDPAGRAHRYRVISVNALGHMSAPTPEVSARAPVRVPSAPSGLDARTGGTTVQLAWEHPSGEEVDRFDVYRYTRGTAPVKVGSVKAGQPTRFEDAGPARGALNFYFVRSVAPTGAESGPSREVGVGL